MTPDESQMLQDLFARMRAVAGNPRDGQAEALIADAVRAQPYAPYLMAQTVLVQQQALENAARRVSELEAQAKAAPQGETSFLGSIGKSLFGGGAGAPAPRNSYDASAYQRQNAAPSQGGPWGAPAASAGGGFLSGALRTAAGVAGGVFLANEIGSLFGGHGGGLFGGSPFGGGGTVNNFYETAPGGQDQRAADAQQDADQDQDAAQDASDYSSNSGSDFGGGGGFDV